MPLIKTLPASSSSMKRSCHRGHSSSGGTEAKGCCVGKFNSIINVVNSEEKRHGTEYFFASKLASHEEMLARTVGGKKFPDDSSFFPPVRMCTSKQQTFLTCSSTFFQNLLSRQRAYISGFVERVSHAHACISSQSFAQTRHRYQRQL